MVGSALASAAAPEHAERKFTSSPGPNAETTYPLGTLIKDWIMELYWIIMGLMGLNPLNILHFEFTY